MNPEAPPPIRGTLVVTVEAGRALRFQRRLPLRRDLLGCSTPFAAGDAVWVTMRGGDGGQLVVARAISAITATAARAPAAPADEAQQPLLREQGLDVLWYDRR